MSVTKVSGKLPADGKANDVLIRHNLGTRAVIVQVFDTETGAGRDVDCIRTDKNSVTLSFYKAPDEGVYTYVIIG